MISQNNCGPASASCQQDEATTGVPSAISWVDAGKESCILAQRKHGIEEAAWTR
jgi:hypothetical protein